MNPYTELLALTAPERLTLARFSRRGALTRLRRARQWHHNLAELDAAELAVTIIDDVIKNKGAFA